MRIPGALRLFAAASICLAALGAQGCLSKATVATQTFMIDPPAARSAPVPGGVVLALSRVQVAPAYAGQSLIYRTGAHGIERDPYARLAAPPGWLLTSAIRGYLANADFVRDVVLEGSSVPASATVEVAVTELEGDLSASEPAAILTLQFRVVTFRTNTPAPIEVSLKTYTRRNPIAQRTAKAVVAGWNEELGMIMAEFETDLKAALAALSRPS